MIASTGANYHGLDIAANPVAMGKHRLELNNKIGDVRIGSMLECPFPDNHFDFVISIGCFHHTGDMQACVNQTHRILKSEGTAVIMVYNKFSLRQWLRWPRLTTRNLILELLSKNSKPSTAKQRNAYDSSGANEGAPETEFFSTRDIKKIFSQYSSTQITCENFDENFKIRLWKLPIYSFSPRFKCLNSKMVRNFGLDHYIIATK